MSQKEDSLKEFIDYKTTMMGNHPRLGVRPQALSFQVGGAGMVPKGYLAHIKTPTPLGSL